MFRKTLTILSLVGLLLSVAAWVGTCFGSVAMTWGRNLLNVVHGEVVYLRPQGSVG